MVSNFNDFLIKNKVALILLATGLICGYFLITTGLPITILAAPVFSFFFKFSKEKLSSHLHLFSFVAVIIASAIYFSVIHNNLMLILLVLLVSVVLNLIGKVIEKHYPVLSHFIALIYWILIILFFMIIIGLSVDKTFMQNIYLARTIKGLALLFSGVIGIPPSPLFMPAIGALNQDITLYTVVLIVASIPAIFIKMVVEFKSYTIDTRIFMYFVMAMFLGLFIGASVAMRSLLIIKISILIPSITLLVLNFISTMKIYNKLKK